MNISQLSVIQAFLQLGFREKLSLIFGGGLSLFLLSYFLLIEPWLIHYQQTRQIVIAQQQDLIWMQMAAQQVNQLRTHSLQNNAPTPTTTESLFSLIDRSIGESGLNALNKRIEPQGETEVRVSFDSLNFNDLIRWIAQLQSQYQIKVHTLTIERETDKVKARLSLTRF